MTRILILAIAMLLFAAPVSADSDVSASVTIGEYHSDYDYGLRFHVGDARHNRFHHRNGGLQLFYNDGDFSAQLDTFDRNHQRFFHDRGGYRTFIPQGGYNNVYYGNNNRRSAPVLWGGTCNSGYGYGQGYCQHGYNYSSCNRCNSGPVVIQYGYPGFNHNAYSNQPQTVFGVQNQPFYTAPSFPEYGYLGADVTGGRQVQYQQEEPQVYNDNRTYNYFGENAPQQGQPLAAPQPTAPAAQPEKPQMQGARNFPGSSAATRFYEEGFLNAGDSDVFFQLYDGELTAAWGAGPGAHIADGVVAESGVLAYFDAQQNLMLVYQRGTNVAASVYVDGKWRTDELPYLIDSSQKLNIGLVGGSPWVVFTDLAGTRYVVSYDTAGWYEVGSGSKAEAETDSK